jgi:hypothetical protein
MKWNREDKRVEPRRQEVLPLLRPGLWLQAVDQPCESVDGESYQAPGR